MFLGTLIYHISLKNKMLPILEVQFDDKKMTIPITISCAQTLGSIF